jgi:hypothetical protein
MKFWLRSQQRGFRIYWLFYSIIIPRFLPSSSETALLELMSSLLPTSMHATFWLIFLKYSISVLIHLLVPDDHVVEGFPVGDVVDYDDAVGSPVVAIGDGPEPFLACGVPLALF